MKVTDSSPQASNAHHLSDTRSFQITVLEVNRPPTFSKGTDQVVLEDSPLQSVLNWASSITVGPLEDAGSRVEFVVTTENPDLFAAPPRISEDGTLTYAVAPNASGVVTVSVRATDDGGTANGGVDTSAPQTFNISVTDVNDPPAFAKGIDQVVNEDAGPTTVAKWATDISPGATNESTQKLAFEVSNDNSALFSSQPAVGVDGTLTFTPAPDAHGTTTVTAVLKDDGGTENGGQDRGAPQTFALHVRPINDPPAFVKGPDQTIGVSAGLQNVAGWATSITPGPADESDQIVTFELTNTNPALFSDQPAVSSSGELTYAPMAGVRS